MDRQSESPRLANGYQNYCSYQQVCVNNKYWNELLTAHKNFQNRLREYQMERANYVEQMMARA